MDNLTAWAAGFFDAQGYIRIGRSLPRHNRVSPSHSLMCWMRGRDSAVLEIFGTRWGATVRWMPDDTEFAKSHDLKGAYSWDVAGIRALQFLRDILPHLRTGRTLAARLGIQFHQYKTVSMGGRGGCLDEKELAWREMHRRLIKYIYMNMAKSIE